MSTRQQRRQAQIETGRDAALIEGLIAPFVDAQIQTQLKLLISKWRTGTMTHDEMVGVIGGLAMLDAMISDLHSKQSLARTASEEEYGNG